MKIPIRNQRGHIIGVMDIGKSIYSTVRDYNSGEIFRNPKYLSAIGLSLFVIEQLKNNNIKTLIFNIINYEKESFQAIISLNEFLEKGREFQGKGYNCDKQIILSMNNFYRRYYTQEELIQNAE